MTEKWLKCTIAKGMFSGELVVVFTSETGQEISVFVPKEVVKGDIDGEGKVKVRVFDDKGKRWVVLPTPTADTVPIADENLVPA